MRGDLPRNKERNVADIAAGNPAPAAGLGRTRSGRRRLRSAEPGVQAQPGGTISGSAGRESAWKLAGLRELDASTPPEREKRRVEKSGRRHSSSSRLVSGVGSKFPGCLLLLRDASSHRVPPPLSPPQQSLLPSLLCCTKCWREGGGRRRGGGGEGGRRRRAHRWVMLKDGDL